MHPLIALAKSAVEHYLKKHKVISIPSDLSKEFLKRRTGTFVTIEKDGKLRGCIGTYLPTRENIAKEIIHNAVAAASEDCRFEPIREQELPLLSYTVYILNTPELVDDIQTLNPKKFGIIVKTTPITRSKSQDVVFNGHFAAKTGLLLPGLDGIETTEKQVWAACQKAGINPAGEQIIIYKFTAEKHEGDN